MASIPTIRGTWRSDRKRTMAEWRSKTRLGKARRTRIARMFGKLEVTYAAKRHTLKYDDLTFSSTYRVEAADSGTVVVRIFEDGKGAGYLQCLHFESPNVYWITVGWNREWFSRVAQTRPNKSLERTRER
jgi:hypothetical protein